MKASASSVTARVKKDIAVTSLTLLIENLEQLHKLLRKLEGVKGVRTVYRVTKRERASGRPFLN